MVVEFVNLAQAGASHLAALYHLAGKYQAQRVLLLCRDLAQATELDAALWAFEPSGFLPHGLAGEEDAAGEEILLSPDGRNLNQAQVLLLAYNPPQGWLPPANFARVVELLPSAPDPALEACRQRYRQLGKQAKLEHTTSLSEV